MNGIQLDIVPTAQDVHMAFARWVANFIAGRNARGEPTRLILPVGPTGGYPILTDITNSENISWRNVQLVTMDEYLDRQGRPLKFDHPLSFTGFMKRFLTSIKAELRPRESAYVWPDPFEIDRVANFIDQIGGIDACLGGIGVHGHVAFNEPAISRFSQISIEEFAASVTRVVPLAPETIVMNATRGNGGRFDNFPRLAVTLGMADLLSAAKIRLFCDGGAWQQEAVARAVAGDIEVAYPVTILQRHGDVSIVADQVSAMEAVRRTSAPLSSLA